MTMSDHHHLPPPEPDHIAAGGITFWGIVTFGVVIATILGLSGYFWQTLNQTGGAQSSGSQFYANLKAKEKTAIDAEAYAKAVKTVIENRGQGAEKPVQVAPAPSTTVAVAQPAEFVVDAAKAEKGKALFTQKICVTCHSIDGSKLVGPTMKGFYGRKQKMNDGSEIYADADYFKKSIKEPASQYQEGYPPAMPAGLVTDDADIEALLHYVSSLK